jgi:putative transposase
MASLPCLTVGDRLTIDGRDVEFLSVVGPERDQTGLAELQFREKRNHRVVIYTVEEFDRLYLDDKVAWASRDGHYVEEAPEEPCEAGDSCAGCARCSDRRLRANRLHLLRAFDANPVAKTDVALQAFLDSQRISVPHPAKPIPRAATFRRLLRERGNPGDRRQRDMGDRRRRGPRKPRIHPEAERILWQKAELYWTDITTSAKDVYADVHTALSALNRDRAKSDLDPIGIPGRTTVWRLLTQHCDYNHARTRFGARKADQLFKAVKGRVSADRILDLAIIDHTVADCFVVDDEHAIPVGRPYLTFCIDVRSRYPLGYVVSFTPPSVETVMACLRRVVRPKIDAKERYPELREWPAFGLPRTILVDNGLEFTGTSFAEACQDAGISVEWAPVRAAAYKGIQERFFGILNEKIIHKLQGGVPYRPHILKEYGIDPSAKAVLLLSDLDELIHHAITEVYGREFHSGIRAVPEQVWRSEAERYGIDYAPDLRALDRSFARVGPPRVLSRTGIEWMGLDYSSDAVSSLLNDLLPRVRRRRGRAEGTVPDAKFKYWPEDIAKISVWNEVRRTYIDVTCTQPKYATGLSEHVHHAIRRYAEMNGLAFSSEEERCAARTRLYERARSFVNDRLIGTRRNAARWKPRSYGGGSTEPDVPFTPVEATSSRQGGEHPLRISSRSGARNAKRTLAEGQRSPPSRRLGRVPKTQGPPGDPFATVDRQEIMDRARVSQKEEYHEGPLGRVASPASQGNVDVFARFDRSALLAKARGGSE